MHKTSKSTTKLTQTEAALEGRGFNPIILMKMVLIIIVLVMVFKPFSLVASVSFPSLTGEYTGKYTTTSNVTTGKIDKGTTTVDIKVYSDGMVIDTTTYSTIFKATELSRSIFYANTKNPNIPKGKWMWENSAGTTIRGNWVLKGNTLIQKGKIQWLNGTTGRELVRWNLSKSNYMRYILTAKTNKDGKAISLKRSGYIKRNKPEIGSAN